MKLKIFLTGLFLIICLSGFSQARIGYTESQIRSEFSDNTFYEGVSADGYRYISTKSLRGIVVYYFDEDGFCDQTRMIPYTMADLNYLVQLYNAKYVIISDTHWKAYVQGGGILDIYLRTTSDGTSFFYII